MKIPASPLLFTLALSSSTLAYPTPRNADASPNPESSPLLPSAHGTPDARTLADDGWGMMKREKIPGRFARRFGVKRQAANTNGLAGPATGLLSAEGGGATEGSTKDPVAALGGLGLGSVGQTLGGVAGGVLGPNGQRSGIGGLGAGLLGDQGALGGLGGTVKGLPVVGGVVGGVLGGGGAEGLLKGLPVVGGVMSGAGGLVNGLPLVGGIAGGLVNQAQQVGLNAVPESSQVNQLAQSANLGLGQGLQGANAIPSLVANLGEGRYLLSSGQIINLGNLGTALSGGSNGGLVGQLQGTLGGIGGTSAVNQIAGQNGLGGLQGTVGGLTGSSGLPDTGRYVNLGGQLVPLDQAREILSNAGVNGIGSYTSDPTVNDGDVTTPDKPVDESDDDHETPAEAFQAADPNGNSTDTAIPGNTPETQSLLAANPMEQDWDDEWEHDATPGRMLQDSDTDWADERLAEAAESMHNGYQNPFPDYRSAGNDDALALIMGTMGGIKAEPPTASSSISSSGVAMPSETGAAGSGAYTSGHADWSWPGYGGDSKAYSRPAFASSSSSPSWSQPTPTPSGYATPGSQQAAEDKDGSWHGEESWGDWVSAQPSATGA